MHFFWKNIFKIKLKYLLIISKSVVRLISAITNNRSIPDSEHNLDAALNYFLKRRPIWDSRLDDSAVEESMWNPTVSQDKKFSTFITQLPGPCSSQSQRSRHLLIGLEDTANDQRILQQKILSNSTAGDDTWSLEDWRGGNLHLLDSIRWVKYHSK